MKIASLGQSNFESLYGVGVAIFLMAHFFVNIGMNIGIMPITGTILCLFKLWGTHMLTVFMALGILMGMRRYSRHTHPTTPKRSFSDRDKNMDIIKLEKFLKEKGEKDYRLKQIKKAVFCDLINNWDEATTISKELREEIKKIFLF